MQENQRLVAFLAKQAKQVPAGKRESLATVIESINLCPLVLNLEDSLDLIGVDDFAAEKLKQFFNRSDNYVPKRGSAAEKMIQALWQAHPNGLAKIDILNAIGYRPPPITTFRGRPKFYGPWASIKTLEAHGVVARSNERTPKFNLTEQGLKTAEQLFGTKAAPEKRPSVSLSMSLVVAQSEMDCRMSIDVRDVMRRTQVEWRERKLPVGSIWFCKGEDVVDCVVQFASNAETSDDLFLRRLGGSPFSKKVLIVNDREKEKHSEVKMKAEFEYDIGIVYLESAAEIASYLTQLAHVLDTKGQKLGTIDELSNQPVGRIGQTVGSIWVEQLKLVQPKSIQQSVQCDPLAGWTDCWIDLG